MKTNLLRLALCAALCFTISLHAEDAAKPGAAELEAKFKETMTAAMLTGRWSPLKDGVLAEAREDRYQIVSAEKVQGDNWTVNARMKRGEQEVVIPIPVKVKWAGDSAVMIVDQLRMPGAGGSGGTAYSARVLFHGDTYAGTWSGGDRAGLLMGVITKGAPQKQDSK